VSKVNLLSQEKKAGEDGENGKDGEDDKYRLSKNIAVFVNG